jgi:hypothetical protein
MMPKIANAPIIKLMDIAKSELLIGISSSNVKLSVVRMCAANHFFILFSFSMFLNTLYKYRIKTLPEFNRLITKLLRIFRCLVKIKMRPYIDNQ